MLRSSFHFPIRPAFGGWLRPAAAALALLGAVATAHAGGVAVGVDVAVPVASAYGPGGYVSVRGGGGYRHGGYYRGGYGYGWGYGLGLGLVLAAPWYYEPVPQTVIVEQQPAAAPLPAPPSRPEPVIYPRNGQTAQQTESDRQECNRWAATQPAALADSSVFMRAVEACMDGRGYTMK